MANFLCFSPAFYPIYIYIYLFFLFYFYYSYRKGKEKYWIIFLQKSNHFSKRYARLHSKQEMLHNVSAYAEHLFKVIDDWILYTLITYHNAIFYALIASNPLKRLVMIFFFMFSDVPGFKTISWKYLKCFPTVYGGTMGRLVLGCVYVRLCI